MLFEQEYYWNALSAAAITKINEPVRPSPVCCKSLSPQSHIQNIFNHIKAIRHRVYIVKSIFSETNLRILSPIVRHYKFRM